MNKKHGAWSKNEKIFLGLLVKNMARQEKQIG